MIDFLKTVITPAGAFILSVVLADADVYTFGGYSWNQKNTPDRVSFLGEGKKLGGAIFSDGLPKEVTRSVDFPATSRGFDARLTLGFLKPDDGGGARALNLPLFNDGSMVRHGLSLSWSGNRMIPNLHGPDFVVFESGEGPNGAKDSRGPELFMVRARNAFTQKWTPWFHKGTRDFKSYGKQSAPGAFITSFDFEELGIPFGDSVNRLEIANMVRTDSVGGSRIPFAGPVIFDNKDRLGVKPRPLVPFIGSYEQNLLYGPDMLYVASLQNVLVNRAPGVPPATGEDAYVAPKKTLSPSVSLTEEVLVLLAIEGDVAVFDNHNGQFLTSAGVYLNMTIGPGYSIVTGDASAVTLLLPDGGVIILQPGSLLSLDRVPVADSDKANPASATAPTQFMIHLIRGSFLFSNQSDEGEDLPFEMKAGRTGLRGSGGLIYFQFGQPLRENQRGDVGTIRKRYFELKTGLLSAPGEPIVLLPVDLGPKRPGFAPPDINPSNLPDDFSPYNLPFQGLAFLNNPIIPDGTGFGFAEGISAPFDKDKFLNLLIPGGNLDDGGVWSGTTSRDFGDLIGDDGQILLDETILQSIGGDPHIQKIFGMVGEGKVRLTLDGEGNPIFVLEDGTEVTGLAAPETVKQLLAGNPSLMDILDLSSEGLEVVLDEEGNAIFRLEDGGASLPGLAGGLPGNLQISLDEDGNMVFLPEDGISLPDIQPPGIIGDTSLDQVVVKKPEGVEGQVRRAHAQRVSQIASSKAKQQAVVRRAQQQKVVAQQKRVASTKARQNNHRRQQQRK